MSQTYFLTKECDECGELLKIGIRNLSGDSSEPVEINIELECSQLLFKCENCDIEYYNGDIEFYSDKSEADE